MNLVNEENGSTPAFFIFARLGDCGAQVFDAGEDRRQRHEARDAASREQARESGLACARRAPEYERRKKTAALYDAAQHAPLADQVLLADELGERARSNPLGERRGGVRRRFLRRLVREETLVCAARHGLNTRPS